MGEVAVAWYSLAPQKGLEILQEIETKGIRIKALLQMALPKASRPREEWKRLLDQAVDEVRAVKGLTPKIQLMKDIAHDSGEIDQERAKATYREAYHILDMEYQTSTEF